METFRYRKHIRWFKGLIPALLIALAIGLLIWIPPGQWSGIEGLICGLLIGEAIAIWIIFGRLAAVEVSLTESGIHYRSKKGVIEIPYGQITEIRYPSIPYLGGWIKIVSESSTLRLTVVLHGIGTFVRNLKVELDRCDLSSNHQIEKLFRFYKTAEFSDQSWERGCGFSWKIALLFLLSLLVGAVLGIIYSGESERLYLVAAWSVCSLLLTAAIYTIAELVLARRLAKGADAATFQVPGRDRAAEKQIFKKALLFGATLYIVAILFVCFGPK